MLIRAAVLTLAFLLVGFGASAQERFNLYEGPAPGTEDWEYKVDERQYFSPIFNNEVVTNVSQPTLTAFLPKKNKANGTAVIVAPGGGFHALSIDSEGNDVAKWLNERGVAAFVLRYRLVPTGEDGVKELISRMGDQARIQADMARVYPHAGADGLAAVRFVRERAEEFNIAPDRIGFMGFSAGGTVAAYVAFNYEKESLANFVAPVYAAVAPLTDEPAPKNAPPMFIVAATDDQLGLAKDSITLYSKWLEAGRSVELHMYAKGGHGFGMKTQDLPSDSWIERFGEWMEAQGFLEK